jgi:predicted nucleic acid-binding protein
LNGYLIFLGVNVPMYAAGQPHRYKTPCSQIMKAVTEGELSVAIDTEIIQEILCRYGALQRREIAVPMALDVLTLAISIYPVTEEDIRLTVDLFERDARKGATARDLIHAAVMKTKGLTEIISVDALFDLIDGIRRIDPASYASRLTA